MGKVVSTNSLAGKANALNQGANIDEAYARDYAKTDPAKAKKYTEAAAEKRQAIEKLDNQRERMSRWRR